MALVILPHVMTARRQIAAQTRLYQSAASTCLIGKIGGRIA
jgi:hypothetical protein